MEAMREFLLAAAADAVSGSQASNLLASSVMQQLQETNLLHFLDELYTETAEWVEAATPTTDHSDQSTPLLFSLFLVDPRIGAAAAPPAPPAPVLQQCA